MGLVDVTDEDVVAAITGVSAALAGFSLVFLGVAITAFQGFPSETARVVASPYRRIAGAAFAAFSVSLLSVAFGIAWLAFGQPRWVFASLLALSLAQLILVLFAGLAAIRRGLGS